MTVLSLQLNTISRKTVFKLKWGPCYDGMATCGSLPSTTASPLKAQTGMDINKTHVGHGNVSVSADLLLWKHV